MKTPNEQSTTLNSYPYHYLGLTDYVQLEMEARRMRARAIAVALQQGWAMLVASFRRQAAEAELRALDDRTLHDMGLNRTSIPAAVAGDVYRPSAPSNDAQVAKVQTLKLKAEAAA
ncbi:DUF1127 domain-containing protein [Ferrovibrio xuzhouensis]|uniref:DUF1127 domain-containing protein n=1 Tax=Ferrovibrio xuzhouensis TaxID=1576914 RepID=A0ABV7VKQ8_9PROT